MRFSRSRNRLIRFPNFIRVNPCDPWLKFLIVLLWSIIVLFSVFHLYFIRVNPCNPWLKSLFFRDPWLEDDAFPLEFRVFKVDQQAQF